MEIALLCSSTWAAIKEKFDWSIKAAKKFKNKNVCSLAICNNELGYKNSFQGLVKEIPQEPIEQQKQNYYITKIYLFYYWAIIMFGSTSWENNTYVFSSIRSYFKST